MKNDQYERSRIVTLPFINLDSSNLIYTAQCEKHGLQVCPVTFEELLYIKATEIVASAQDLAFSILLKSDKVKINTYYIITRTCALI